MDWVWGMKKGDGSGPSYKFCSSIWMNSDGMDGDGKRGRG